MGLSICKGCDKKFPTEEMKIVSKKKYCSDCYDKLSVKEPVIKKVQVYKCTVCSKCIPSEERVLHNKKTYCKPCLEKKKKDSENYKKLMDFIWEQQEHNQGRIVVSTKNVKSFHDEYGYTYSGIYSTLQYMIKHKEKSIKESIGLVPYYYDEAKEFYRECHMIATDAKRSNIPLKTFKYVSGCKQPEHKPRLNLPQMSVADLEV